MSAFGIHSGINNFARYWQNNTIPILKGIAKVCLKLADLGDNYVIICQLHPSHYAHALFIQKYTGSPPNKHACMYVAIREMANGKI